MIWPKTRKFSKICNYIVQCDVNEEQRRCGEFEYGVVLKLVKDKAGRYGVPQCSHIKNKGANKQEKL